MVVLPPFFFFLKEKAELLHGQFGLDVFGHSEENDRGWRGKLSSFREKM